MVWDIRYSFVHVASLKRPRVGGPNICVGVVCFPTVLCLKVSPQQYGWVDMADSTGLFQA